MLPIYQPNGSLLLMEPIMPEVTVLYQGNTSNNHSQKSHCVSYAPSCGWSVYVLVGVSLSDCKNWADCTKLNWKKAILHLGPASL